jgi:hypothetical protein
VAGINLSPEHAAIIGTVMSILLPFTPSIFSRRKQ